MLVTPSTLDHLQVIYKCHATLRTLRAAAEQDIYEKVYT